MATLTSPSIPTVGAPACGSFLIEDLSGKSLAIAGLSLDDIGLIELNEAFAGQALAVMKEAGLNPEITNVNGGAVALGHPLGATGAKLTATILNEMERRQVRYGMVTMCVGGGQGAAGIFERI